MTATLAYVGSQGRNLFLRNWTNKITQVLANGTVIRQFDIVNPDGSMLRPYAEIDYKTSGGWDSYNAVQVSLGTQVQQRPDAEFPVHFRQELREYQRVPTTR